MDVDVEAGPECARGGWERGIMGRVEEPDGGVGDRIGLIWVEVVGDDIVVVFGKVARNAEGEGAIRWIMWGWSDQARIGQKFPSIRSALI